MLLGAGQRKSQIGSGVDSVHNYYENLVIDELYRVSERCREDGEYLADTACVALNRLPPRYIRHDVDMTFFMSTQELTEIATKVEAAVKDAIEYVDEREAIREEQEAAERAAAELQAEALRAREESEEQTEDSDETEPSEEEPKE